MSRYRLSPEAQGDLDDIKGYLLSEGGPRVARRVLDEIRRRLQFLAANPGAGHSRDDLTSEPVKFWPVFSYLIVYDPAMRPLGVARILHASRDIEALFTARPPQPERARRVRPRRDSSAPSPQAPALTYRLARLPRLQRGQELLSPSRDPVARPQSAGRCGRGRARRGASVQRGMPYRARISSKTSRAGRTRPASSSSSAWRLPSDTSASAARSRRR